VLISVFVYIRRKQEMDRVAIVTGAGRGIGRAIALRLAKDGLIVAVNDVNADNLNKVAKEIEAMGCKTLAILADVSNRDEVYKMVDQVVEKFGRLDVMVANAGITHAKPFVDITIEEWDRLFNINCKGVFLCDQAAVKQMLKQKGGKIINCSSIAGVQGTTNLLSNYSATKFAVRGFSQVLSRELAPHGITVNVYCPGVVDTEMWGEADEQMTGYMGLPRGGALKHYSQGIPLGRIETPDDVAGTVSFLASTDSDYMTGQTLIIDGGLLVS
jgi:meso-butanediol dehydrogenase/(S,S)-butanediol dehydrogenase/diacetyl reductase